MSQLSISQILCLLYIFAIFCIFKMHFLQFSIWFLRKYQSLCSSSVYDELKYFTETMIPRAFLKIILSHSFLSYSSFCVNIFSKNFLLFVPPFGHVTVKNFIEYLKFGMCLKQTLSHIFFS